MKVERLIYILLKKTSTHDRENTLLTIKIPTLREEKNTMLRIKNYFAKGALCEHIT